MSIAGEEGDVCQETFESCREWLISGFEPAYIWNQDETGTKRKALPEKSLGERGKHGKGGNDAKERIVAGFFVIATCGKETPILILVVVTNDAVLQICEISPVLVELIISVMTTLG